MPRNRRAETELIIKQQTLDQMVSDNVALVEEAATLSSIAESLQAQMSISTPLSINTGVLSK